MRLFLSSYRAGNHADRLVLLFGEGARVAVITNAKDYKTVEERAESVAETLASLHELGFSVDELDLRSYFGMEIDWGRYLSAYDAVWLTGGNVFILRRALAQTRLDDALVTFVRSSAIAYGGESAGAVMATPDFTGIDLVDDREIIPTGYDVTVANHGLALVDYAIVPHYQSELVDVSDVIVALKAADKPYRTLTDQQAIVVDGAHEELL